MGIVGSRMTNFGKMELGGLQLGREDSEARYKRENFTSERLPKSQHAVDEFKNKAYYIMVMYT